MLTNIRTKRNLALLSRSPDLGNQRTGNIQFNRRLWRWLHLSRKCHAKCGKRRQKCSKRQQRKEKAGCGNLPQLAEFVRLATPLARFGKVVRTASKQRAGSSSLPRRAILNGSNPETWFSECTG